MKKNSVAHFEIYADDPDALGKFYTSLFDWTIEPMAGMDYRLIRRRLIPMQRVCLRKPAVSTVE